MWTSSPQQFLRKILKDNRITDPEGQVVLEERYLCYAKWEDIASELGYTVRQIFRVHDAALKEIVDPESCQ